MAGIYLHIPFCKKKCHYCDFHFSTKLDGQQAMVDAIIAEVALRSSYLDTPVETIYLGGGTPSLLSESQLSEILKAIRNTFQVIENAEVTLECNPDDLDETKLTALKKSGVNRLSIGIQSFDDEVLTSMNRAHNSTEALNVISMANKAGFENITADLIYGIPDKKEDYWEEQVRIMLAQNVQHISAYCLTIEPKTVFGHQYKKGQLKEVSDEDSLKQFNYLKNTLSDKGFQQYEISNFSKVGFISKHNSAYWLGKTYLGLGPSAHSYNGDTRSWNVANNSQYVAKIKDGLLPSVTEVLSAKDKFNDYILTRLRTIWGISKLDIEKLALGLDTSLFFKECERHLLMGNLLEDDDKYFLAEKGKFIADGIASDLFI